MEFRFVIDAPKAGIRRLALFVGLPIMLLGVTAAVAHATYDTSFVASGQPAKALPLKTALDDIQSRLVMVEALQMRIANLERAQVYSSFIGSDGKLSTSIGPGTSGAGTGGGGTPGDWIASIFKPSTGVFSMIHKPKCSRGLPTAFARR